MSSSKVLRHHARVRSIRCLICAKMNQWHSVSAIHHIGDSAERNDYLVIPLCNEHHQGATGFHGLGEKTFNMRYKTSEIQLLGMTIEALA